MAEEILFDEILLDPGLFTIPDATGSPEFANTMARAPGTGQMAVNIVRYDPQHVWQFDFKAVTPSTGEFTHEMDYFNNIWYGGWGSAYGLRVRIETDHLAVEEVLGTGDGTTTQWFLTRTYNRPGTTDHPYIRYICKPVPGVAHLSADSVTLHEPDGIAARVVEEPFKIFNNGVEVTSGFTISNTTGILTFSVAPLAGHVISWTGQFDTPMRFATNSFQQKADFPAEIRGIQLIEIMPVELGL